MGFAARAARLGGPNLDSERSERIVSEANESKFVVALVAWRS